MEIALERDWCIEPPDIPRDLEQCTAKLNLIPPMDAAGEAVKRKPRRDTAQKLARKQSDAVPVHIKENPQSFTYDPTKCKIHPFVQWLMDIERNFARLVLG